jgi:predicted carbohydrate-binding protein with CBM5 and CBM33 domain
LLLAQVPDTGKGIPFFILVTIHEVNEQTTVTAPLLVEMEDVPLQGDAPAVQDTFTNGAVAGSEKDTASGETAISGSAGTQSQKQFVLRETVPAGQEQAIAVGAVRQ